MDIIRDRTSLGCGLRISSWLWRVLQSLPLECYGERSRLQRFHLLQCLIVTDQNHWYLSSAPADELGGTNLCLFDEKVESADTTTITSRHTIDFIHDQTCACTDSDACDRCALSVSFDARGESYRQLTCRPVPLKKPSKEALSILVEFYPLAKTKHVGIAHLN